ncbi:MAG TPA: sigma-70 family RNA polymerase sigma factor [Thermoanaerobaculia bacterium]|nr:sigma-70 family RNA polymerase sigma factor [Thermoanaerobaculia bacterium]
MIPETPRRPRHPQSSSRAPEAEASIDSLFDRHAGLVRRAVRGMLLRCGVRPDPDRIRDLEQEVWCRLIERLRRGRSGPRRVHTGETVRYLRRVAASTVVDHLRSSGAAKRRPAALVSLEEPHPSAGADPRSDPESGLLAREELRRRVEAWRRALRGRAAAERFRIVRLAWLHGLPSAEIARRLGGRWTPGGIDSMLCRLRARLEARGEATPPRGLR